MPADTFNHKPVLELNGEMVFAELAILRIFQKAGWQGRWIDTYRRKFRIGYWGQNVTEALPPKQRAILDSILSKSGCFDVFCWREDAVLFVEAKWKSHDAIRATQRRWLEAALDAGLSKDSFLITEWSLSRPPISKELQLRVFQRDKWVCRWCNRPVIFAPVMKLLANEVNGTGPLSYYHAHWTRADAPLLDELGAVIDHVEAHSSGGSSREDNLATACNKCNGRKSAASMKKFAKRPQRKPIKGKYGEPQYWDGLSSVFVKLAAERGIVITQSEKEWLKVLTSETSLDAR